MVLRMVKTKSALMIFEMVEAMTLTFAGSWELLYFFWQD